MVVQLPLRAYLSAIRTHFETLCGKLGNNGSDLHNRTSLNNSVDLDNSVNLNDSKNLYVHKDPESRGNLTNSKNAESWGNLNNSKSLQSRAIWYTNKRIVDIHCSLRNYHKPNNSKPNDPSYTKPTKNMEIWTNRSIDSTSTNNGRGLKNSRKSSSHDSIRAATS